MIGTTGTPGQSAAVTSSTFRNTSGLSGGHRTAWATGAGETEIVPSARSLTSVARTSAGFSSGSRRQLTTARARCGSALSACPAARRDAAQQSAPVLDLRVAAVCVDAELGVDQVAPVGQKPRDAVIVRGRLLAGRERQDQVAVGDEALALEPDQRRDQDRRSVLDVDRAAPVEVAVLLDQFVRIEGPVLAPRLDHVQVREKQDRAPRAAAAQ